MKIDLTIRNFTGENADSYRVRYARVDNTSTPVFLTAGNITAAQFPYTIPNVDNGQYTIGITPVYADLRACSEIQKTTPGCALISALNAQVSGSNLRITYTAPGTVPQVYLTVNYPNGGSYQQAYTNGANGSVITIPIPAGLNGNYTVYMQSICDPDTGFYSPLSPPVTVNVATETVFITNSAAGIVIALVNGITGYALSSGGVANGGSDTGTHTTFTGAISAKWTGTIVSPSTGVLSVNGEAVSCLDLADTNGGSIVFPVATYYTTDIIAINFETGECS